MACLFLDCFSEPHFQYLLALQAAIHYRSMSYGFMALIGNSLE